MIEKEKIELAIDRLDRFERSVRRAGNCVNDLMLEAQIVGSDVEATVWGVMSSVFREIYQLRPWEFDLDAAAYKGPVGVTRVVTAQLSKRIDNIVGRLEEEMKKIPTEKAELVSKEVTKLREEYAACTRETMLFAEQELPSLLQRLENGQPLYVTKTLGEQGKHQADEKVNSVLGVLRVVAVNTCEKASDHPFPDTLPESERKVLDVSPFDVIELERA